MIGNSTSSLAPDNVPTVVKTGGSYTGSTPTVTWTGVPEPDDASQAFTVNAASGPLAFPAGVQNARWVASMRLFVAALKRVADAASAPIRSTPLVTPDTRNTSESPSTSASLAAPASFA